MPAGRIGRVVQVVEPHRPVIVDLVVHLSPPVEHLVTIPDPQQHRGRGRLLQHRPPVREDLLAHRLHRLRLVALKALIPNSAITRCSGRSFIAGVSLAKVATKNHFGAAVRLPVREGVSPAAGAGSGGCDHVGQHAATMAVEGMPVPGAHGGRARLASERTSLTDRSQVSAGTRGRMNTAEGEGRPSTWTGLTPCSLGNPT